MATRLYFHNATSGVGGTLPSTEQSSKSAHGNFESQSINRSMDTTIGLSQVTKQFTITENVDPGGEVFYVAKFVSEPLNQSGLSANTWTYNFAARNSSTDSVDSYPTYIPTSTDVPLCCYVWRPSTGAKVGNILDGDGTGFVDLGQDGTNQTVEKSEHGSFSGSSVAGTTAGDVIIFEAWINVSTDSTTASDLQYFFDGTTETLNDSTTVSNHASFIETPENLSFQGDEIAMTLVTQKTYSNKFINDF